jgi:hypothetical protein
MRRFLQQVAQTEKDALNCLEQAHAALSFLYQDVLGLNVGELPFPEPPRLLDRLRRACRVRHYSPNTEACYVEWSARFIRFHYLRHPTPWADRKSNSCSPTWRSRAMSLQQLEHQIAQAMRRAGLDPAFIHAFEKTGLLVSEDNRHLIPDKDLQEWDAAVADCRRRHNSDG